MHPLEMAPSIGRPAPNAAGGSTASSGANTSTGHAALDIDALANSIKQDMQKSAKVRWPDRSPRMVATISKVDKQTRAVREDEYTPHDVPIGPYHRGHLPSKWMTDEEKLTFLRYVLEHVCASRGTRVVLGDLLKDMERLEGEWLACYADKFGEMGRNEFMRMMLLDGCYLLACFVDDLAGAADADAVDHAGAADAAATVNDRDENGVRDSFYLLENQIPFTVLEKIYEPVTGLTSSDVRCKLAARVQQLLRDRLYIGATPDNVQVTRPHHLLHLVHQQFTVNLANQAEDGLVGTGRWRRATEYCSRANVRFKRRVFPNDAEWSVLDVSLVGGTLRMPRLRVDTNTWTILRNLMALEPLLRQTSASPDPTTEPRVTAYCLFMSQVACTAEDVELLGRAGVVEHFLGSDAEAAAGFANLCKGVVLEVDDPNSNYLKPTWHDLEWRYRSRKHNLVAWFRQTHCRNQCYAAAFVVAVIVFFCAVLQVVFAGLDYGKK